jgi:citronellol/citronellal dehydrogenase
MNKVAIITGATRGIGRALAIGLSKKGYNIVIAGKTTDHNPKIPGTIYSVAKEIELIGTKALPIKTDMRNYNDIENLIYKTNETFGRLDLVINNAGALSWKSTIDSGVKEYDLINAVNSRGAFFLSKLSIPLLKKSGGGHIIYQSPPLPDNIVDFKNTVKNKSAYMISKWGMTIGAIGLSEELKGTNIGVNTLWPMTPIESFAVKNNNLGDKKIWRKSDIIVDSVLHMINEDPTIFTGNQLIDETYLRTKGHHNFEKYQCELGYEPPKLTDINHLFKSSL